MSNLLLLLHHKAKVPLFTRVSALSPLLYWTLEDAVSSTTALEKTGAAGNILPDPSFDKTDEALNANWNLNYGNNGGSSARDTGNVHTPSTNSLKMISDTSGSSYTTRTGQTLTVVPGLTYQYSFWTYGDGSHAGRYAIRDNTHSTWFVNFASTGVTATAWTKVSGSFTTPAGCVSIIFYLYCNAEANGVVTYFDDCAIMAPTAANPHGLTLSGTGQTFGQAGIGDGLTSLNLNGNGYLVGQVASKSLLTDASALLLAQLTIQISVKAAALSFWAGDLSGSHQAPFSLCGSGSANQLTLVHGMTDNPQTYHCPYYWGNTLPQLTGIHNLIQNMTPAGLSWYRLTCTVDQNSQVVKGYFNGVFGAQNVLVAPPSDNGPAARWSYMPIFFYVGSAQGGWNQPGNLAHVAIWNRILTDAEIMKTGKN